MDTVTRTTRPARLVAGALALWLAAGACLSGAGSAAAADGDTVELPVLKAELAAGDPCTEGSARQVTAVPWEQVTLQLGRAWQSASGAGV
ncbi:peptidase, partial [Streptomyces sp. TRM76130]|nr:peptidase [Streptomyces sp. TRM76130]